MIDFHGNKLVNLTDLLTNFSHGALVRVDLQFEESNIRISDVLNLVLLLCSKQNFPVLRSLEVQAPNVYINEQDVYQAFSIPQDCGIKDLQLNLSDNKFSEIQLYNIILSFTNWHREVLGIENFENPEVKLKTNLNLNRCEFLTTKVLTNLLNAELKNIQPGHSVLINARETPTDPQAVRNFSQKSGVKFF